MTRRYTRQDGFGPQKQRLRGCRVAPAPELPSQLSAETLWLMLVVGLVVNKQRIAKTGLKL